MSHTEIYPMASTGRTLPGSPCTGQQSIGLAVLLPKPPSRPMRTTYLCKSKQSCAQPPTLLLLLQKFGRILHRTAAAATDDDDATTTTTVTTTSDAPTARTRSRAPQPLNIIIPDVAEPSLSGCSFHLVLERATFGSRLFRSFLLRAFFFC